MDIETTGLDRFRDEITSIQIGFTNVDQGKYVRRFFDWKKLGMKRALMLLTKLKDAKLVTHNGKFDLLFLYVKTRVELKLWVDTLVMAHVCGEEELGLKPLTKKYFKVDYDISKEAKTGKITEKFKAYGLDDVYYPMELVKIFKKKLKIYNLEKVYKHEMRVYKAYLEVEKNGAPISPRRHEIAKKLQEQYKPILERLLTVGNINWNSTAQVAKILFTDKDVPVFDEKGEKLPNTYEVLEYTFMNDVIYRGEFDTREGATLFMNECKEKNPHLYDINVKLKHNYAPVIIGYGVGLKVIEKTAKGVPSVGSDVLVNYVGNPVVDDLLEYRRLTKLETFIKSWEEIQVDDRIYPSFNITARTGRTTCNNPNLQNIPQDKNVRNLIEARPGWKILECDLSQVELRVASIFSGDENMQHAYQSGSDLHSKTTMLLFGDTSEMSPQEQKRKRTQAKSCFSGDTEILTENGFVEFKMYDGITPVAQYNKGTKTISYEQPVAFVKYEDQPVYKFSNDNTSIICTGNHNILLTHLSQRFAGEFINTVIEMDKVHTLPKSRKSMTIHAGWYKNDHEYVDDRMTRVIASIVSDGHITEDYRSIEFSFKKKRKFTRFVRIMNNCGIYFEQHYRKSAKDYYFFSIRNINETNAELFRVLRDVVDRDKTLTRKSLELLNPIVYLDEAQYWDGSVDTHGLCRFTCSNYTTISLMQEMAVLNGIRARLSEFNIENTNNKNPLYCLSYNLSKDEYARVSTADFPSQPTGSEDVYCVQMRDGVIVTRHKGKVTILPQCNFGFLYGMSAKTFVQYAKNFGLNITEEDSEHLRENFFKAYPTLLTWHEDCIKYARANGYTWSPIGRKRFLPDINSSNFRARGQAERQSINSGVQGFASDMCTSALADIVFSKEIDHDRCIVLGSVHDAILFEIRDDYVEEITPKLKYTMEHPSILEGLDIPIPIIADAEVAQAWGG